MRYLDPKADLTFKKVFGEHPDFIISFLNALLPFQTNMLHSGKIIGYISFWIVMSLFGVSCSSGGKKNIANPVEPTLGMEVEEVEFPASEVLNLKSYYISSVYQRDSITLLYGYNNKVHALDCFDLNALKASQLTFAQEGASAVTRPVMEFFVCSPDSIWLFDASQRFFVVEC